MPSALPGPGPDYQVPAFDVTNNTFPNIAFGACYGQTTATGGPTPLIQGLTISQFITAYAQAANSAIVYIGDKFLTALRGYPLEAGKSVTIDTRGSANTWWVMTANGSTQTVAYISNVSDAGSY